MALTVATIGYEQATQDALLEVLKAAGVQLLVDVRAVAASRRPGFAKRQLAAGAEAAGIGYLHLRGLGTPAEGRHAVRSGHPERMRTIFEVHLATDTAQADLAELVRIVESGQRVCLLCLERDPLHCHRSIVADELRRQLDVEVQHLTV
jgi:uncharacterized protein (DUF488 family)